MESGSQTAKPEGRNGQLPAELSFYSAAYYLPHILAFYIIHTNTHTHAHTHSNKEPGKKPGRRMQTNGRLRVYSWAAGEGSRG